jgi:hypothetical protein
MARFICIIKKGIHMHNQSDYGYPVPQLENRDKALCLRRAAMCERLASDYPAERAKYEAWAKEWRDEAVLK